MSGHDSDTSRSTPPRARRALGHRRYRWLMVSHACAATGQTLGTVAIVAVVYRQTRSPALVSLTAAARLVPYLVGSGLAGTVADRHDRARVLGVSIGLRLGLCTALAGATALDAPAAVLIGVTLVLTAAGTCGYPAVVASVPGLVTDDDLVAANGILTSVETAAFILGPALGGALLVVGTPAQVLLVNAVVFGLAGLSLRPVGRLPVPTPEGDRPSLLAALGDGVRTIVESGAVAAPMALVVVVNVVYGSSLVTLILVADDVFGGGGRGFGVLSAGFGAGALVGVVVANRGGSGPRPLRTMALATALAGLPFALLALPVPPLVAVVAVMASGAGSIVAEVLAVTVVQRHVPADMTARVFGLLDMVIIGAIFAGSALAPPLITALGLPGALVVLGAGLPVVVGATVLRREAAAGDAPTSARVGSGLLGAEVDGA